MSNRWPGGVIRKTPVTPAGPLQNGAASGVWSLADAAYWTKQGLWPLAGNTLVVEDVFSTYLYTGNGTAQTITNGINLSGQGGMVWTKARSQARNNGIIDTTRGITKWLNTNSTNGEGTYTTTITSVSSTGFAVGSDIDYNQSGTTMASWTFRKAPKFFDVVTWTGNGTNQFINHNLGVTPGFVIYKATSTTSDWFTLARGSDGNYTGLKLNLNNQASFIGFPASIVGLTSTTFNPNEIYGNTDGVQYVAYLYAHDAASDGVIQCGSYTGNGSASGPVINLGWEPQWLMVKNASVANTNWQIIDNMRGMPVGSADATLQANLANAESSVEYVSPTATGFQVTSGSAEVNTNTSTYVYVAIRRGPMRTPTLGTSVFAPVAQAGGGTVTTNFPVDTSISKTREASSDPVWIDRIRGFGSSTYRFLASSTTGAEVTGSGAGFALDNNTGYRDNGFWSGSTIYWNFRRAPGFMDVVCYRGTSTGSRAVTHNLGVAPEMVIVKQRTAVGGNRSWWVLTTSGPILNILNDNSAANAFGVPANLFGDATFNNYIAPTATTVTLSPSDEGNNSSNNYVMYLFASCPGVSKVGTYTGNGSSQTINCAFTTGARFVLIKRTDSTGGWLVWDSARGIVAGNDPYLALNTSAAEVTTDDSVDTASSGFIVNQVAASNVNVNGATYIFLAIA